VATRRAYAAIVVAVVMFGLTPLFVRGISASALCIATYRNWFAIPFALVIAAMSGARLSLRMLWTAVPGGILFSLTQVVGITAIQETSVANATLIPAMVPLPIVIIAALFMNERLRPTQIAWAALALTGVIAVILGSGSDGATATMHGDLLACVALATATGYLLVMKLKRSGGATAAAYIAGIFVVSSILLTPLLLVSGDAELDLRRADWLWVFVLALVTCGGHVLLTWSQSHVEIGVASVLMLANAVIAAVGAWVCFGQVLTSPQIVGGIVVLAALAGLLLAPSPAGVVAREVEGPV
jgi:drug/metabolite transporter (DMT)-like permease